MCLQMLQAAHLGPAQDFKTAVVVFDQGGTTFDPIPVVAVHHAVHVAHLGRMDMPTNHAVSAPSPRLFDHSVFKLRDVLDRVFDFVFEVRR